MERRPGVVWYGLSFMVVIVLAILLMLTMLRLNWLQQEMSVNEDSNMVWVIYQAHTESQQLVAALHAKQYESSGSIDIPFRYQLLASRLELFDEGPQRRALQAIDAYGEVSRYVMAIREAGHDLVESGYALAAMPPLETELRAFNSLLSGLASRVMIAQLESAGARLDQYRQAVQFICLLVVGIVLGVILISLQWFLAMRRSANSQKWYQEAHDLQVQLENERQLGNLHRRFGSMIFHQFRTPLAVIDASMQRLVQAGDRMEIDEIRRRADKVRAAAQRLNDLMERIVSADRFIERLTIKNQVCNMADLVEQILDERVSLDPEQSITVQDDTREGAGVSCDPALAREILSNMLSAHIIGPGPARVRIYRDGNRMCCEVESETPGLVVDDFPQVFERHFMVWASNDASEGSMSLYIASELAALQNGEIVVGSDPGSGPVFTLCLPASV